VINVGIIGGETDAAGELIRILINHPDVILRAVCSPEQSGKRIDQYHRGLTGDTDLCFVDSLDTTKLNCVFLVGESWQAVQFMNQLQAPQSLQELGDDVDDTEDVMRVIDMTGSFLGGSYGMVYGFPEHYRKAMVRGSLRASIPTSVVTAVELALFPMAKNHLLSGRIEATVELPQKPDNHISGPMRDSADDVLKSASFADSQLSTRLDPVAPIENRPDGETAAMKIAQALRDIDGSFAGEISLKLATNPLRTRGIKVSIQLPCLVNVDEVKRIYNEAYSDHSFTFVVDREPQVADIANTNKCLMRIESGDRSIKIGNLPGIKITSVIDNLIKGSAGTAVHCMNLLFGLSEKTGLALKASVD
jgi:N-acetyl-gamma-glutamyl-phosphate reductase